MAEQFREVTLVDKYTKHSGTIFLSGAQALVRLPMLQKDLDNRAGLNTAGYISGYRGSPLGGYDAALWGSGDLLKQHDIHFQPGVNEDLAATSVWGTQQLEALPNPSVDGVFSIWYGKGPGVDRAGDALKHGNFAGTNPNGGVLVVYGDDHPGKSSTVVCQSEQALSANNIPSLYPANVAEYFQFGLLGWAMSRYAGLWVGFKTVNETIEQTSTVDLNLDSFVPKLPDRGELPDGALRCLNGDFVHPQLTEVNVLRYRLPLIHRFVRANGIDRVDLDTKQRRLGIVTAGKAYQDVQQALQLLGIDSERADQLGVSVYKVGCIWPLEPEGMKEFARGQQELFFVEEKRAFVELQAASILYHEAEKPRLTGKHDEQGVTLLPSDIQLDTVSIALAIASRLQAAGVSDEGLKKRALMLKQRSDQASAKPSTNLMRTPAFCSGCPHNTSTNLPEGSLAMGGIGCHGMASFSRADTMAPTQMGGEGLNWAGLARFTDTPHIFQNIGDGTYYHSGLLAIRAAIASGVNITYKILYNDAVAMTGGQPVDGPLSVGEISHQVVHEGAVKCVVVTDSPDAYNNESDLAAGVEVYHRDELESVQRMLRDIEGCTVMLYEQTCATEKRRRRKRGKFPDPAKRLFINDAVCEGCGDCSVQSNCVSIQPKETAFGRKRQIDQSNCNKDYSCVKGFCPSFVTVYGGELRKPDEAKLDDDLFTAIPEPKVMSLSLESYNIMIAGVGGTGVITVGALLGMAAHLEGKACSIYDMTGIAQKNGAVYSHLKIADNTEKLGAQRLGPGDANLLLGFDLVASIGGDSFPTIDTKRTHVIGNSRVTQTAAFQRNPDAQVESSKLEQELVERVGQAKTDFVDATGLALALLGNTIAANLFVLGFASQRGLLPVGYKAIERAVELNGVAITFNLRAFSLGRLWAHDSSALSSQLDNDDQKASTAATSLKDIVTERTAFLTGYQNEVYAQRYKNLVDAVASAETQKVPGKTVLAESVARYFAKLMAYKDEYEVARLYADPAFMQNLQKQFQGDVKLKFNLAPPLLSKRDPITGHLRKREFGGWIFSAFRLLARFKFLRGTRLDIFGYTAERRMERVLIDDYEKMIRDLLGELTPDNHATAVELAQLPEHIRGFGHVKERHIDEAEKRKQRLFEQFKTGFKPQAVKFVEPAELVS